MVGANSNAPFVRLLTSSRLLNSVLFDGVLGNPASDRGPRGRGSHGIGDRRLDDRLGRHDLGDRLLTDVLGEVAG